MAVLPRDGASTCNRPGGPECQLELRRQSCGSPRDDRWQASNLHAPGKNRELCRLSYGARKHRGVTGRDRTCDASRFRRALYRAELRPREWLAEPESNRRPPPYQRGALPPELSAVDRIWARLDSNQQLLACETSALPLSYSPALGQCTRQTPGQGVEPRSPRSERGVLPVRRSRNDRGRRGRRPLRPAPARRELDAAGARLSGGPSFIRCHVRAASPPCERCFPCLSPTLQPWIADRPLRTLRRSSSYVEELWSPKLSGRFGKSAC